MAKMAKKGNGHFGSEDWVDFANGTVSPERKQAMQQHLNAGCETCSKLSGLWGRVSRAAKRESSYEPPESALRHVRHAFVALTEPRKKRGVLEIPRLVFDSLWQPALAGVRSTAGTPRQVLYRTGEFAIEMRLEPEPVSERVNIAGQLSRADAEAGALAEVAVVVSGAKGKVAETVTNRFGEFQLTVIPEDGLRISFAVLRNKEVSIPLDGAGIRIFYGR